MDKKTQTKKAEALLALHHDPKLLVLPNVWDPLGARMLEHLGFPSVATASAAVAFSLGYDDGEQITFDAMLEVVSRICSAVDVPVTADVESGYARDLDDLADNIRRVVRAGAVGINLEDSTDGGKFLLPVEVQCDRLRAARSGSDLEGVPIVINARIDVFFRGSDEGRRPGQVDETIERAGAYIDAGADCVYPILVGDIDTLKRIRDEVGAPINVYAAPGVASMRELEDAGIARLSIGPWMLKAALTRMKDVASTLKDHDSYDVFTEGTMTTEDVRRYLRKGKMA